MAAGGYVSVSSQRDAEQADIPLEARELRRDPRGELRELAGVLWWPPGKDQRPLPDAVARRARRGDRRRPPALRWAGRPDRPAPRCRRVVGHAVRLAYAGVAFAGPSCEVRSTPAPSSWSAVAALPLRVS